MTVRTNWKSYIENSLENFHLPTVHHGSIGGVTAQWNPIDGAPGNYVLLQSRTTASRATLDGDAAFDRIATLRNAVKLLRLGKLMPAIEEYVQVVEDDPRDWATANTLGDLYIRANRLDKFSSRPTVELDITVSSNSQRLPVSRE